jgi:subtilisin family serine protease
MSLSPLHRPILLVAALLAALAVVPAMSFGAAVEDRYIVVLDEGTDAAAKASAEERRGNDVDEVFDGAIDGFTADLDAADVARLEDDPRVVVVERDEPVYALGATSPAEVTEGAKIGSVIPGRYLVTLADDLAPAAFVRAFGATPVALYTHAVNGFAADLTAAQVASLAGDARVVRIEPDRVVGIQATQTGATWGLDRIDQRQRPLNGTYVYDRTGDGVTAYIIDTGILPGHQDFGGRVRTGFTAFSDSYGSSDCNGHGTHVAGTVAGARWGVAKEATLVPVRVLSCSGSGSWSGVVAGIDWTIADHAAGTPAVANMSLGGGRSSTIDAAVRAGVADGITFVVAAGNSNTSACNSSPAGEPLALTVGSTTSSDARSSFSNYGTCVDLFAPGSSITSAWWTSSTATNTISGTSMASPHVAGAAALVLDAEPAASPATVAERILTQATPSVVTGAGTGSPNLLLATDVAGDPPAPTLPGAPRNLTAAPRDARVILTFDTPADSGNAAITDYVIEQSDDVGATWTPVDDGVSSSPTATVTGLVNGTAYAFRVAAVNSVGQGPWTTPVSATPDRVSVNDDFVDGAVISGATGSVNGSTADATRETGEPTHGGWGASASIWYRWTAPGDGALVLTTQGSGYDTLLGAYTGSAVGSLTTKAANDDNGSGGLWSRVSFSVQRGATYAIAIDGYGGQRGASVLNWTFTEALPPTEPTAPRDVLARAGNRRVAATWSAPASNGGSRIIAYTATASPGGAKCETPAWKRYCVIRGLENGVQYTVTVTATNAVGTSPTSLPSDPVVPVARQRGIRAETWGLDRLDQRRLPLDGVMDPSSAGASGDGAGVRVYVIDTGIRSDHLEFDNRVLDGFVSVNQGQDDGNGTEDCNGHGTHVTGTAAGAQLGVAAGANVVPVRVLNCYGGGYGSDVLAGLDWIASNHPAGTPGVVNMSLGGGASAALNAAVQEVIDAGLLVVVAAGNSNADACYESPASAPNAITVGATDSADVRASFSNYGSCVDLFAPGVGIPSAWHTGATDTATLSGTSMAAPHVAGAAAILYGAAQGASASAVADTLITRSSSGIVGNAGPGSPNRLLYIGTAPDTAPQQPEVAPAPAPAAEAPVAQAPAVATPATPAVAAVRKVGRTLRVRIKGTKGARYQIFRNGKRIATTRSTRMKLRLLKTGKRQIFSVRAIKDGKRSGFSQRIVVQGSKVRVLQQRRR